MVRVNLLNPKQLADQHLIAEYDEILMLLGYVSRFPSRDNLPPHYCLGKGHIRFFKDKLLYLKKRHDLLKKEMRARNFKPTKTITLSLFPKALRNDWVPQEADYALIKRRIAEKLIKKLNWYRYYGEQKPASYFIGLLK